MRKLFILFASLAIVHAQGMRVYPDDNPELAASSEKKVTALGTVEPEAVVDVGSQVNGIIVSFGADPHADGKSIDYGSHVEVGTVLAQIDSTLYSARVDVERAECLHAEAELEMAKLHLEQAQGQWQDAQEQRKRGTLSNSDYNAADIKQKMEKVAVAMAETALAQKKATLKQAEIELGYTTIRSPVKGVIIDRRVNVGQTVVSALSASSLFLVADLEKLRVWTSVNEADIGRVHKGQHVRFTVDAYPGKSFEGEVKQIRLNATMTQNVVTYTVVVAFPSANTLLLPYMTAHAEFE